MTQDVSVDATAVIDVLRRQNADLAFQLAVMTARAEAAEQRGGRTDPDAG